MWGTRLNSAAGCSAFPHLSAVLAGLVLVFSTHATAADQPNLIWIMADDLGYGELGCYGQKVITTPHLDRMAREGLRFTHFYAGATVCAPSRSVLMTGQHHGRTRVRGNAGQSNPAAQALQPGDLTVAKVLQEAGYRTALVGKWGLGDVGAADTGLPRRHGFDEFFGYLNQRHAHNHFPDFLWRNEERVALPNVITPIGGDGAGYATQAVQFADDLFADEAIRFVLENKSQPFFLYWSMVVPHANNERNRALKNGAEVPDFGPYASSDWPDPDKGQAAMISRLDSYVGRMLDTLREQGLSEKTLVIFTSDNGPHNESNHNLARFNPSGPLKGIKRSLTDGGIRVPMIAWWPGRVAPATESDHVGYFGDWMATAAELAGAATPEGCDSISFAPALFGHDDVQKQHEFLYWEFHENGFRQAALYQGRWKGIRSGGPDTPVVLYDQQNDVAESNNVAARYPEIAAKISEYLRQARSESPDWKPKWTAAKAPAAVNRPNIVVFLVDDMGVMDTSVPFLTDSDGNAKRYPLNEYYRTPHMERLAECGIRFNNFCAMSVCSPTRISLMTGQNAARHRTTNWINPEQNNAGPLGAPDWNWKGLKKGDVTLAGLMSSAGYRTIHVGKGHFGPRDSDGAEPRNLGFQFNVAGASFGAPASYFGIRNYGNAGGRVQKSAAHAVPHLEKYHGTETFLTEALTLEAKALVSDAVKDGQPFFLYFSHYAVHAPFNSDPRFAANYIDSGMPPQAQAFATLIEGMDKSLGDLRDHLETLGVAENTLIFFLGDNGSDAPLGHEHEVACAAPLRGKKGSHYEGGMRVPFIAAWSKENSANPHQQRLPIAAGAIQPQLASVCDLFPTILNFVGGTPPTGHVIDGVRLDSLLTGKADPNRPESFLMHYPHAPHRSDYWTSFRDGAWKVIYHYFPNEASENLHYQLYNLATDPFEQTNLAASHPSELHQMMKGLIAALDSHNATYAVSEDRTTLQRPILPD